MDLVIIGAGGHSKDLEYLASSDKYEHWNVIGHLDDDPFVNNGNLLGDVSFVHFLLDKYPNLKYTIAINSSAIRRRIESSIGKLDRAASLIHETAVIGTQCHYQNGLTMGPYSVLTTRVNVGAHVHINTAASINQSSTIGDYCTVSPGARICGDVNIGEATSIGAGSVIVNFKNVGKNCTLGAGTVVIDHIGDDATVVGVPGREIKRFGEYI
jgi:acetyltransferase EpsM